MSKAAKFWIAFAFAIVIGGLTAASSALDDNIITTQEWATIALAFASAGAVYFVPNAVAVDDLSEEDIGGTDA